MIGNDHIISDDPIGPNASRAVSISVMIRISDDCIRVVGGVVPSPLRGGAGEGPEPVWLLDAKGGRGLASGRAAAPPRGRRRHSPAPAREGTSREPRAELPTCARLLAQPPCRANAGWLAGARLSAVRQVRRAGRLAGGGRSPPSLAPQVPHGDVAAVPVLALPTSKGLEEAEPAAANAGSGARPRFADRHTHPKYR
jgi:hypothetical protein